MNAARRNDRRASNCHRSLPMAEGQSPERSRRGAVQPGADDLKPESKSG